MKIALATLAVVSCAGLAACASTTVSTTPVQNSSAPAGKAVAKTSTKAAATVAHVGSTIAVSGYTEKLNVQLAAVMDPATADNSFEAADAGKRLVGTKLVITNTSSKAAQDDANNQVTLVGSDNQDYSPTFSSLAGCTNFSNGQYTLAPAASATGCVAFQVPVGVKIVKVQFSAESGFGNAGLWLNP